MSSITPYQKGKVEYTRLVNLLKPLLLALSLAPIVAYTEPSTYKQRSADQSKPCLIASELSKLQAYHAANQLQIAEAMKGNKALQKDSSDSKSEHALTAQFAALLIESMRQRDLDLIERMIIISDNKYRFSHSPDSDSKDSDLLFYLDAIRTAVGYAEYEPALEGCSLSVALYEVGADARTELHKRRGALGETITEGERLKSKYRVESLRDAKLSEPDNEVFQQITKTVGEANHYANYLQDLQNIERLNAASQRIYENSKQDLLVSGGDFQSIAQAETKRTEALPKEDQLFVKVLWSLDKKFPSKAYQDFIRPTSPTPLTSPSPRN